MTRGRRIQRAEKDLFSRHPERIVGALERRELDPYAYALLSFLVSKIDLPGRNGEIVYTLAGLAEAFNWPYKPENLRRKLHELRDLGWVDFEEPRRGPNAPWIIRLSGAAIDGEAIPVEGSFHRGEPLREETNSTEVYTEVPAEPTASEAYPPTRVSSSRTRGAEQSRAEIKNVFEEGNYDQLVGKGTEETDRFLDALREVNGGPPVRVAADEDGELEWSQPSREGEAGIVADCQALVDAGIASWVDANPQRAADLEWPA